MFAAGIRDELPRCTVKSVADDRVPDRGQVYSDLVRAPGVDSQVEQGEFSEGRLNALADSVVRNRLSPAAPTCGHARSPKLVAADAAFDGTVVLFKPPVHQRD